MKKLNLNSKVSHDDEKLINLLKTSTAQKPSKQFVKNTLDKFLSFEAKQKIDYKPLKFPLYMMLVIGLMLFIPFLFLFSTQAPIFNFEIKLKNLIENMPFHLDSWYTISPILLVFVTISIVWIQLSFVKFQEPFS